MLLGLSLGLAGALVAGVAIVAAIVHYGRDLPNHQQLSDYRPATATRVHAGDGSLLGEFAIEKRVFVPISAIPQPLVHAFISAEDKKFFHHPGIDSLALVRAVITNVRNLFQRRRPVGASTITQQVAKNFLLTNEVSFERKIKEAILALRIERALSKDQILELYLNEIYLGRGAYGVAAAALTYFEKPLDDLTIPEAAYLAALPKAPSNYDPKRRPEAALARRNWVIGRMEDEGYINPLIANSARAAPLIQHYSPAAKSVRAEAGYFLEEVRRELVQRFGEDGLYRGGLSARTTLNPDLQELARRALSKGLIDYDRRHGWRGPLANLDPVPDTKTALAEALKPYHIHAVLEGWRIALVQAVDNRAAQIIFADATQAQIPMANMAWARPYISQFRIGFLPETPAQVLNRGDVILVSSTLEITGAGTENSENAENPKDYKDYYLVQLPQIDGALVAMDPHTGRVLAMTGGFHYERSEFNRAVQAQRQPGSAVKPFVYLAALEAGYTPATVILDAPFVIDQGVGLGKWKPENFSQKFYGPSPMRIGIERSRNLMTVRLANTVGMQQVGDVLERFDIVRPVPPQLSYALGAGDSRLINMTAAYSALVNGGHQVTPTLIDRVQDRLGNTVYRHDNRLCLDCQAAAWAGQEVPKLPDTRPPLTDPTYAYQIVSMLEGVVRRGTGRSIAALNRPLAGKTGTTNDARDAWFVGFSPDLAVGVYAGFDTPTPLGRRPNGGQETGSSVAAPIFKAFMAEALQNTPKVPFRTPPGIRLVRIDPTNGLLAGPGSSSVIEEAFVAGSEPQPGDQMRFIGETEDRSTTAPTLLQGLY